MLPWDSLDRILFEQSAQQIRKQGWCSSYRLSWPGLNLSDRLLESACLKGRQSCWHFVKYAAKSPDIRLETVYTLFIEKFRGHVIWCTILAFRAIFSVCCLLLILVAILVVCQVWELSGQTKVAELERTVLVEQHVRGFQVAIYDTIRVQVVKALSQVAAKLLNRLLGQFLILFYQLEQVSTSTILEDNP